MGRPGGSGRRHEAADLPARPAGGPRGRLRRGPGSPTEERLRRVPAAPAAAAGGGSGRAGPSPAVCRGAAAGRASVKGLGPFVPFCGAVLPLTAPLGAVSRRRPLPAGGDPAARPPGPSAARRSGRPASRLSGSVVKGRFHFFPDRGLGTLFFFFFLLLKGKKKSVKNLKSRPRVDLWKVSPSKVNVAGKEESDRSGRGTSVPVRRIWESPGRPGPCAFARRPARARRPLGAPQPRGRRPGPGSAHSASPGPERRLVAAVSPVPPDLDVAQEKLGCF